MKATFSWLVVMVLLAGCSTSLQSSAKQFAKCGKLDVGHRMEVRVDFDEPMQSSSEPCPDRREIYDQNRKSSSVLDQSFSLVGTLKF